MFCTQGGRDTMLPITIISDCCDDNARMRLTTRAAALIPDAGNVAFCGAASDLEAAGHLVDALDALTGAPGLIMLNVAPRNGCAKQWRNGSPLGHFLRGRTHVFTTIGGLELSLLAKLEGGAPVTLALFDVATASAQLGFRPEDVSRVARTQFRSFEFLPRVAAAVLRGQLVTTVTHTYETKAPKAVWYVDAFGNVKLTLMAPEVDFEPGRSVSMRVSGGVLNVVCFDGLAAIPDGILGLTIGSSGLGTRRFLELQIQGGSAAQQLGLSANFGVLPVVGGNGASRSVPERQQV